VSPTFARIAGFVPLVCLGVLEWARLSAHGSNARGLAWVAVALVAMVAVVATERLPRGLQAAALAATALGALVAAALTAGLDPHYLKPRHWDELANGLTRGAETLSSVRLPYAGADPWPQQALDLGGALLAVLAGLLAAWPRGNGRGFPFFAWAVLLVLAVSPVVSLGGEAPVILGVALAIMSILFLWLERLPIRPGLAAAALGAIVLAGALPLGAAADRSEPWFDYKSFAEGLGPVHPERFNWDHDYGPITWPRDGRELFRVKASKAQYWKAETLDTFDGERWQAGGPPSAEDAKPTADLTPNWTSHPGWGGTAQVTISNLRSTDIIGPGTILDVQQSTRHVDPSVDAGRWTTVSELRKGDSYRVVYQAPRPSRAQLAQAPSEALGVRARELTLHVPRAEEFRIVPRGTGLAFTDPKDELPDADISFPPFGTRAQPVAVFPTLGRTTTGAAALRRSKYARTWALAQRLKQGARTPWQYVLNIDSYLEKGFRYTENPPKPAPGREPLDAFLIDDKAGYCQHFSGAMTLLLRMGGIPARVASGFSPGGYQKRSGEWVVRDTDAHSWVEAWFDDIGWVALDPTPPGTPARSQIAAIRSTQAAATDPGTQTGTADPAQDAAANTKQKRDVNEPAGSVDAGGSAWPAWRIGILAGLLAAVAAGLLQRRRRLDRLPPETALARAIAELQVALRRCGHPAPPGTTLAQVERRLHLDGDAAAYVRCLRTSRYGRQPTAPTIAQRRALRRQLAEGLGLRGRLRSLWALPPWRR
jgi:transglutaminase-like putative cysteine protease